MSDPCWEKVEEAATVAADYVADCAPGVPRVSDVAYHSWRVLLGGTALWVNCVNYWDAAGNPDHRYELQGRFRPSGRRPGRMRLLLTPARAEEAIAAARAEQDLLTRAARRGVRPDPEEGRSRLEVWLDLHDAPATPFPRLPVDRLVGRGDDALLPDRLRLRAQPGPVSLLS